LYIDNIISAVIGGIVLLILIWLYKVILPAISIHLLQTGPVISGKWKTTFKEDGKVYNESVTLKQFGRKISATIVLKEDDDQIKYHFKGTFQNLILSGTYACEDEANFERGSILLRYTKVHKFVGQNSFLSKTTSDVVSSKYEWERA